MHYIFLTKINKHSCTDNKDPEIIVKLIINF